MPRYLDHTPLWGEISLEDDQAPTRFERVRERSYHVLPRCFHSHAGFFANGSSARRYLLPINQPGCNESLHQERHSAGAIQVNRYIAPAWLQIGQQRSAPARSQPSVITQLCCLGSDITVPPNGSS